MLKFSLSSQRKGPTSPPSWSPVAGLPWRWARGASRRGSRWRLALGELPFPSWPPLHTWTQAQSWNSHCMGPVFPLLFPVAGWSGERMPLVLPFAQSCGPPLSAWGGWWSACRWWRRCLPWRWSWWSWPLPWSWDSSVFAFRWTWAVPHQGVSVPRQLSHLPLHLLCGLFSLSVFASFSLFLKSSFCLFFF